MSTDRDDFKEILRELFQFDHADLDFGIYRILNRKRDQIETFIQDELVEEISTQVERLDTVETQDVEERFLDAREKVVNTFSEDALGKDDELVEYQETPLGEEYMEVWEEWQEAQEQSESKQQVRRQIYDHLYRFFRRYYDDGDFVTKRRFSAGESKYAIPYDGEEVKLHWANRDQYYVKTSERFTDYRFNTDDYHVHFKLVSADTPTDNTKGDTRYFVPYDGKTISVDEEEDKITIRFEYRPLSDEEEEHYLKVYNGLPGKTYKTLNRSRLCEALESILMDEIEDPEVQSELAREEAESEESLLLTHLNRYTARNTSDYFIHKDLSGFLKGQLDYFIKSEVLHLDDVLGGSDNALQKARVQGDVVKAIGEKIIDFLAQIEDFQKRLFEKKKFVVQTDYCITVDQVPETLYPEILDNDDQKEEWRELYAVDEWEQSLEWNGSFDEAFLETHPHAMIDTGHFGQAFKDRLLSSFDDLDDKTDGLLIHGENFQALNLLQEKYAETVDCVYIDPPYNTGNDGFLYKDTYRHSSWMSMMEDRVSKTRKLMKDSSAFYASIDDDEQSRLTTLLDSSFGEDNFVANVIWEKVFSPKNSAKYFSEDHDYILTYAKKKEDWSPNLLPRGDEADERYSNPDNDDRGPWTSSDLTARNYYGEGQYTVESPGGKTFSPPSGRYWSISKEEFLRLDEENRIWWGEDGTNMPRRKRFLSEVKQGIVPQTLWNYDEVGHTQEAKKELLATVQFESTEDVLNTVKPTRLIDRILDITTDSSGRDIVLDYFAGSGSTGHAVIDKNREDDGDRRYILVEMGGYFDSILMPRLKRAVFTDDWDDTIPQGKNGTSHSFKYHRLESYEDTLNNLRLEEPEGPQKELLYDEMEDYVLQYMLEHETNGSPSLLAEEAFIHPFDYTLQIKQDGESPEPTTVDLVETFHYLIGMTVREYTTDEHQGRRYVSTRDTVETATGIDEVRCIWRDTEEPTPLDLEQEATWAEDELLAKTPADRIYVNGSAQIPNAKPVEIPFRDRMG